jgi:ATP-binding protein involved in chromosome partitioning
MTGEQLAEMYATPFLGSIPLDPTISAASDVGQPAILEHPSSGYAASYRTIAGKLASQASIMAHSREASLV